MPSDQLATYRIRLGREMLLDLVDILERERGRLLAARADMLDYHVPAGVSVYDIVLRRLSRLQAEVDMTIREPSAPPPPAPRHAPRAPAGAVTRRP